MSKTSFKLIVSVRGKVIRESDFSITKDTNYTDIRDSLAIAMNGSFNAHVIKVLIWAGCVLTIMCDKQSHEVIQTVPAIQWIFNKVLDDCIEL
jgi:hypothetical protein